MEQITPQEFILITVLLFMAGMIKGYFIAEKTETRVIFEHCICSHGFENSDDCREYVTGERDELPRLQDRH